MEKGKHLPLCYRLSFDIETMTLYLKIQKWIVPRIQDCTRNDVPLMDYLYKTYGGDKTLFSGFGESGKSFGWNDSIKWFRETEDEIVYSYRLRPLVEIQEHFTLGLLSLYPIIRMSNFAMLDPLENGKNQLVAMEWSDTSGINNCSMDAWVDDFVLVAIKELSDSDMKTISLAMHKTEEVLFCTKSDGYNFRFGRYGEGLFGFQVTGHACTLNTSISGVGLFSNVGRTLSPHNIDNSFQQLYFIVGLAVLHELAEKMIWMKKTRTF